MIADAATVEPARTGAAPWRGDAAPPPLFDASERGDDAAPGELADATADDASGTDAEALLLACCAAQIAAEAGADAVVHASGARRQAALLHAAIAALPASHSERVGEERIVYLPRSATRRQSANALLALLRGQRGADVGASLVVVAIETTTGLEVAQLDRLSRDAGWEPCQLWTDGFARHALHVLRRPERDLRGR